MSELDIEIIFHPEVQWIVPIQRAGLHPRRRTACLLPWICLAFLAHRSRRRPRLRRF